MMRLIKSIFIHKCPDCAEPLISSNDTLCCIKTCPNEHYREETYCLLGVKIVYDSK